MKSRWFTYALLGSVLCVFSCKGGGEGPTFLEIVSFAPDAGRDDVQVELRIGVRVNERIDPSTLTSETFFLTGPDGAVVPSTVSVLAARLTTSTGPSTVSSKVMLSALGDVPSSLTEPRRTITSPTARSDCEPALPSIVNVAELVL